MRTQPGVKSRDVAEDGCPRLRVGGRRFTAKCAGGTLRPYSDPGSGAAAAAEAPWPGGRTSVRSEAVYLRGRPRLRRPSSARLLSTSWVTLAWRSDIIYNPGAAHQGCSILANPSSVCPSAVWRRPAPRRPQSNDCGYSLLEGRGDCGKRCSQHHQRTHPCGPQTRCGRRVPCVDLAEGCRGGAEGRKCEVSLCRKLSRPRRRVQRPWVCGVQISAHLLSGERQAYHRQ